MRPNSQEECKSAEIHAYAVELLRASLVYASVRCVTDKMNFLEDGWVLWHRGTDGTTDGISVYAHLYAEEKGGRGEIVGLAVYGRNLTADKLRSIPLAHIETVANTNPDFRPHIAGTEQHPIGKTFDQVVQQANKVLLKEAYREAHPRAPLSRPDGSNPDGFYRQVAEAYRDVVQTTPKVALALAKEANVPVGTVHRWVLEARRRGFLAPARQGRAG
jgi:hypothetical protein